jgi:hypothetical protein
VGAVVFQFERRDRVLLRDILRLGTATSALLSVDGAGAPVLMVVVALPAQLLQGRPPRVGRRIVPVAGTRVGERHAALGAQPGTVLPAQR